MTAQNLRTVVASSPFDDLSSYAGDVRLRSSDNVDFYIHRLMLSFASPVFRDMFTLTQPPSITSTRLPPVVDVSETVEVLDNLLRLCYPIPDPLLSSLGVIDGVIGAASKYDMDHAFRVSEKALVTFIEKDPLHVFAVGCRGGLENSARDAAVQFKKTRTSWNSPTAPDTTWDKALTANVFVEELGQMPAGAYYRLLSFLRTGTYSTFSTPSPTDYPSPNSSHEASEGSSLYHPFHYQDADDIFQSLDGTEFHVHKAIISFASLGLKAMIDKPLKGATHGPLPIVTLPEHSTILSLLLLLCYPRGIQIRKIEESTEFAVMRQVLNAALNYKVIGAEEFGARWLRQYAHNSPLPVYCIAIRYRWISEAQTAAVHLTRRRIEDLYDPCLEEIDAKSYQSLLKFHHEYRKALHAASERHGGIVVDHLGRMAQNFEQVDLPPFFSMLAGLVGIDVSGITRSFASCDTLQVMTVTHSTRL